MRILNFHDLGEDGNNICYRELIKYWADKQVDSETHDYAAEDPNAILLKSMLSGPYDLVVGTGFGGVLALIVGRATGVRTVLVNPMYPIGRYLPTELPGYEHKRILCGYEHGRICWDADRTSLSNVFLVLGRDDDVTDTARTPAYFYPGNSRFVEGGHFPDNEGFSRVFGELTGGIETGGSDVEPGRAKSPTSQAFRYLRDYFEGQGPLVFFLYGFEPRLMTDDVKSLVELMGRDCEGRRCLYISADELPESQEGLRESYRDVGFLAVDNIRKDLTTDAVKRSLWVVCDEVIGHGGKVLLVSDTPAAYVFKSDDDIMELVWSGKVKECTDWSRYGGEEGLVIDDDSYNSFDHPQYSHYARSMRIDEVEASDGHFTIYWSCPGGREKERALYLYYADGKWRRDEEDGFSDEEVAAMVLRKASEEIIAQTEPAEHVAKGFWGWMW